MLKKVFTGILFFILVFTVVSVMADVYYHHRLTSLKSGKQGWTCLCDFKVFWTAGYKLNNYAFSPQGGPGGEYEKDLEEYIGRDKNRVYDMSESFYHFRYSPTAAFFMAPFALIAYPSNALIIWFIALNIAFLASLLLLVRQISSDFDISPGVRYIILWSVFIVSLKFYLMNIAVGQSDVFVALFFVLFLMAYVRGREIICGIIFALVIQFKPTFLPMLLYFLLTGKRRLVFSALFGSLALFLAPAAIIGLGKTSALFKDWALLVNMSVPSQILNHKNQSITYFMARSLLNIENLASSISAERLFYALGAILMSSAYIALLLFKKILKAAADKKFKYLEISLLIIITLLFSPITWVAHFICLIIPVGVMALFLSASHKRNALYPALIVFFVLSVIAGTDFTRFIPVLNNAHFANIAIGTLFLAYALVSSYLQ